MQVRVPPFFPYFVPLIFCECSVLRGLPAWSLTRAVIMDHLDWFEQSGEDAVQEVALLHRALAPGGFVLLRSAARNPWYMKTLVSGHHFILLLPELFPDFRTPVSLCRGWQSVRTTRLQLTELTCEYSSFL